MRLTISTAWLLALAACVCIVEARGGARPTQASSPTSAGELEVLQLRPNFYMIAGAGANVAVQIGDDGVVVVDAGSAQKAGAVVAAIKKITTAPIRYIINTSADPDHVGGNETVSKAGQTLFVFQGPLAAGFIADGAASILAAENVLTRMSAPSARKSPFAVAAWPTETFPQPRKYMYLNGEGIEILHQPAAHSDGDSIVFFRRSDVIVAGDILDTTRFPVIDVEKGGSIQGEIDALNRLVDMAIPSVPIVSRDAGTLVIPGHGHICDQLEVADHRDMATIIRDRIRDLMAAGVTLEQIKVAAPARGYTRRYGSDSGPWTTNQFVEAVYQSLVREKKR
jgi:cyclase